MKLRLSKGLRLALLSAFCVATTLSSGTAAAAVVRQVGNLPTLAAEDTVTLRWDSTAGESAVWDTEQTSVWVDAVSGKTSIYTSGSQLQFGEGANLNKSVQIGSGHVTASTVEISGSDYCFSGGEMVVTDSLIARESATIDSALVMGSSSSPLTIDVAEGKVLTTNKLGTPFTESNGIHNHTSGSFSKIGGGTLRVTGDVPGLITEAGVLEGKLELGPGVSMDVGSNAIKGGTLENVEMLISGEVYRPVSGGMAVAHNLIKSADGKNAAVLTGVTLHAGTSTEYATLQNVSFAGESTLRGYITFEKTQRQNDMRVAAGGSLTVDNVCFDLHGLSSGEKVLIDNAAVSGAGGTLTGWETASFVYSGIAVNSAAVESSVAGTVTLKSTHDGNLYWTGAADDKWNPGSANWSAVEGGTDMETFTSLSNVYFGADAANRDISVTQDLVVMNFGITDGGYSFIGGRIAALGDAAIDTGADKVTFRNQLVVQGGMMTSGKGALELHGATTVGKNMTLGTDHIVIDGDVTVGGIFTVNAGSATDAGSLTLSGNVTAQEMNISVSAGEDVGNAYNDALVNVTGDLSVGESGQITIGGTAEQHYLGVVRAGDLTVNTQEHDVYFDHLQVGSLTVGAGAAVHVQTSSAAATLSTSSFPEVYLSGTLALDAHGATYDRGYNVYVQDDAASLFFGSGCTIDNLNIIGKQDDSGYTNVDIEVQSRSATVTKMQDLGNLKVALGSLTAKNAEGAVHGELLLDNGKLKLVGESDNLMAEGSGALQLKNGAILDIGSTVQNLSAANTISLSGASSITGDAKGPGLQFADGASISYAGEKDAVNSISANMVVDHTLTVQSKQDGSSLDISGKLSGSGDVQLSGAGTVALSGANSFSGMVTVGENATLSLQNEKALTSAGVTLSSNGILSLDTDTAVYLNSLTFNSGATISFSTITATDDFSAAHAALQVTQNAVVGSGTLNISFAEELDTLRTYNLLTGLSSLNGITLKVQHNGVDLHASQYKVGFDATSGLLYMQTFMGNVWEGQGKSNIWSTANTDGNWSGKSNYNEDTRHKVVIFGDLNGDTEEMVVVQGLVNPGKVYFVAESTDYKLSADADGQLAAGTIIRKEGDATVQLDLSNNVSIETALGDIEVQDGTLEFISSAAVGGTVTVNSDVNPDDNVDVKLVVSNAELMMGPYTVSGVDGTLSGVTMDADGICGTSEKKGSAEKLLIDGNADLTYLNLKDIAAQGNVTLSHDTLSSSAGVDSLLVNVTIGEGVEVDASGSYTLSGMISFVCTSKDDMLLNKGTITLSDDFKAELGKAYYESSVNSTSGKTEYLYKLISLVGQGQLVSQGLQKNQVFVNGVNLADGLNKDIVVDFTDNRDGSLTLSIGNETADGTSDGTVDMPQWDDNWGKTENAPAFSRRYVGTSGDYFDMSAGKGTDTRYYMYDSLVNETNAKRVNGGKAIVVTLGTDVTGALAVGGSIKNKNAVAADHEVWIDDRSGIKHLIGGLDNQDCVKTDAYQDAATHILVNSHRDENDPPNDALWYTWEKEFVIAGSRWCNQNAESYVTVKEGEIYNIFGGSCGATYEKWRELKDEDGNTVLDEWGNPVYIENWGNTVYDESWNPIYVTQKGTSHIFVEGGKIGEIFAAGFHADLEGTQMVNGRARAVEMVLTGGTLGGTELRIFGGSDHSTVTGDIYVRMEGDANILSRLVGGSNAGTVNGNITLDLISGTAYRVDAAGLGWEWMENGELVTDHAYINGKVQVNLYSAFKLGTGYERGLPSGIYGGMETDNHIDLMENCYSTLHFAEGTTYELGRLNDDNYTASDKSIIVTGFDRITLAEKAHAKLALGYFDIDMPTGKPLYISGKGVVEVIGNGENFNFGRDIELQDGATLKVSSTSIGKPADDDDDRTIYVTSGTTLDLSRDPKVFGSSVSVSSTGLSFKTEICGDGVDGKGAIIKRTVHEEDDEKALSASLLSLPSVKLTGNASVGVMNHEVLHMCGYNLGETSLDLNEHTFTKQGMGTFVARNVTMSKGTVLVHHGDFYIDKGRLSEETDIVMAAGTSLYLNSAGLETPVIHTLSGAGRITLNDAKLTLQTTANSTYAAEYMDETQSYDQFMSTTGFTHAVFSGVISDGAAGAGSLIKTGEGVHYISGSDNTYTGGTRIDEGRLYLLGTSAQSEFAKGTSSAASGVMGTGGITWSGKDAELYLGHGARIYNDGTTNAQGGVMTIGVEGAGGVLADFVGSNIMEKDAEGNEKLKYVEIKTHNLKTLAVDAMYADGTKYVAGNEIDRNKMLLVKASDWESVKNMKVDTSYNEAVYSGVLSGSKAKLHKVGVGTLVLDQSNTYTGGTEIEAGTLRVRGWGTLGENEKENSATVQDGATLMFTHNSGYGNEPTSAANNITIVGSGDARWVGNSATDGDTAALISAVGPAVTFTLSGDIGGSGNVRHSGEGVLVLNGDSSYSGGTYVSRGTVEVQSATGLGATAAGKDATVTVEHDADLRVTVEDGYKGNRMVTTLAADVNDIKGDVSITGTADTERVFHMDGNGYDSATTTLAQNGTLLLKGAAIDGKAVSAHTAQLKGNGAVVVSDASSSGASVEIDSMIDYTGDFRVEGDKASIKVSTGTYIGGSIHVAGKQASVSTGSDISIADGESLSLRSTGNAAEGTSAALVSGGTVSVAAGAVFSVRNQATEYAYNLSNLEEAVSLKLANVAQMQAQEVASADVEYHQIGDVAGRCEGGYNAEIAINKQAVGTVQTAGGLTLAGGATYETVSGNTGLAGGRLKLDTMEHSLLTFNTTTDAPIDRITANTQLVLFSDVGGVDFGRDSIIADPNTGVYYTLANRYLTGCDYIDGSTLLVYDSGADVVYLQMATIPEPTTTTLSLLALAALASRRRRK